MRLFYTEASPSKKHGQLTIRPPVCRVGSHPEVCALGWDELVQMDVLPIRYICTIYTFVRT